MKISPRRVLLSSVVAMFLLAVAGSALAQSLRSEDEQHRTMMVGDTERTYLLHVPETLPAKRAAPLLLVFHGGGGHASNMPRLTGFDTLADEKNFIVAYPESFNTHWNDGRDLSPADDVAFVRALITQLEQTHPVDEGRIYATGFSNGGFFSQKLACDMADKIAAVASVSATMPEPLFPVCKPARPVSVMFMHGTKDPIVNIDGGVIGRKNGRNISLKEAANFWREIDHTSSGSSQELPDQVQDGTHVDREVYSKGKKDTEVVVYTIEGGGHAWPGGVQYMPAILVGKTTRNFRATEVIWEFLQKHKLK